MQKKSLFTVLMIVLVLILAGAGYFLYKNPGEKSPESSQTPSVSGMSMQSNDDFTETEVNFSKDGNLTKGPSELGDEGWFLTYEEPGKPALKAELVFDETSICAINGAKTECGSAEFTQGMRVHIEGDLEENFLFVVGLKTADASAPDASANAGTGIANPASTYCVENGGKLEIRTGEDGGQTGYCKLSSGKECEEWAYFRGECK